MTADNHYHIRNKRFTNVTALVDERDATTKRFVTDLFKTKAGTTYVSNELAKKANKKDLNVTSAANNPFLFVKRTTHSNKNIVKFSTGLSDQINQPPGKNGVINSDYWSLVNEELLIKKIGVYKLEYTDLVDGTRIVMIQSSIDGGMIWRQIDSCSVRGNGFTQIKINRVIRITEVTTLTRISLHNGFFSGSGFGSLFIQKIA